MSSDNRARDERIGKTLDGDRYEILRLIGQGGMGRVYAARQRSIDRDVAIKFLKASLVEDDELRRRFEREAKLIAQLQNPHCVMVHDYGQAEDGSLYMVMELLTGENLRELCLKRCVKCRARP